jgi:DNA invertase Pin-like site-specific DNA recombinase
LVAGLKLFFWISVLAAVTERDASFRSLKDPWADITTAHGRLMLTGLGGLAKFERELIRACPHQRREALQRMDAGESVVAASPGRSASTGQRSIGCR